MEQGNRYLEEHFISWHNTTLKVAAREEGTAFVPIHGDMDLDRVFSIHHDRVVQNDNTVHFARLVLQIPKSFSRYSFAKCRVMVYEHLDSTLSIGHGPHTLGRYRSDGSLMEPTKLTRRAA